MSDQGALPIPEEGRWVTCTDYARMGCTRYPDGSTFIPEVHAGHRGRPVMVCQATMPELRGL